MSNIPTTISMAKLYNAQGYCDDSKKLYDKMGLPQIPTQISKPDEISTEKHRPSLSYSLEIKIDQWVTLLFLQRQTELW